jgi:ketosteroid isomerase-like protein
MIATAVDTVRRFYDALSRGDVPGVLALLNDELQWTEAERFPYYGGTWRSPREIVDNLLVPLARDWDGFTAKAVDFVADGDRVVSFGTYAGRLKATGRAMTAPFAHRWTVRDGRIVKFDMYADTAKLLEAIGR